MCAYIYNCILMLFETPLIYCTVTRACDQALANDFHICKLFTMIDWKVWRRKYFKGFFSALDRNECHYKSKWYGNIVLMNKRRMSISLFCGKLHFFYILILCKRPAKTRYYYEPYQFAYNYIIQVLYVQYILFQYNIFLWDEWEYYSFEIL